MHFKKALVLHSITIIQKNYTCSRVGLNSKFVILSVQTRGLAWCATSFLVIQYSVSKAQ